MDVDIESKDCVKHGGGRKKKKKKMKKAIGACVTVYIFHSSISVRAMQFC